MPYIIPERRKELDEAIDALSQLLIEYSDVGDYNYTITRLVHEYIRDNGIRYKNLNDVVGILECAKQEFIRTVVSPYEQKKLVENSSVSELDSGK